MGVCARSLLDFNNKIIITKNGTHARASHEDTPKQAAVVYHQLKNMSPPLNGKLALESLDGGEGAVVVLRNQMQGYFSSAA